MADPYLLATIFAEDEGCDVCVGQARLVVAAGVSPAIAERVKTVLDAWGATCERRGYQRGVEDGARGPGAHQRGVEAAAQVLFARAMAERTRATKLRAEGDFEAAHRALTAADALEDAGIAIRALTTEGGTR